MSSAAVARAEARRKAILSRGADRLSKLTTSGRGEDAPAYMHDDPPVPKLSSLGNFSRETTPSMPPANEIDPSVWSDEQQQQLMQALMMGRMPPMPSPSPSALPPFDDAPPSMEDNPLLAQLMAASGGPGGMPEVTAPPKHKTLVQKLFPIVHLLAMWLLLAYFTFFHEPKLHEAMGGLVDEQKDRVLVRWASFSKEVARVQVVPFFWALTTIQVALHSTRLFAGLEKTRLPALLGMAMPVLPPHIASIVVNGYKYIGLFSMLLDDVAAIVFGIGLFVYFATWFAV